MTTTTTTHTAITVPPSARLRRRVIAVLAGAAIVASTGVVVSRAIDRDASVGAPSTFESTLDVTLRNGAIHVFTAPDEAVAATPGQLVVDDAAREACATGHADACPFTHTWAAHPLPGIGDIIAGMASGG